MNPNSIYSPDDKFNRIRPYCIFVLLILLFLLLILLAPPKSVGKNRTKSLHPTETAEGGSGSGRGGGIGNAVGKGSGNAADRENSTGTSASSTVAGSGNSDNKSSRKNNPLPASPQQPPSETAAPSKGTGKQENKKEVSAPDLPVKQWKSTEKPTRSEAEIWHYAKLHIRNIAKDKRDTFEFPEYGVPDTSMKKISGNIYEVNGFFKLKTHNGQEKMYRFSLKMNLANYLCHDMEIKTM